MVFSKEDIVNVRVVLMGLIITLQNMKLHVVHIVQWYIMCVILYQGLIFFPEMRHFLYRLYRYIIYIYIDIFYIDSQELDLFFRYNFSYSQNASVIFQATLNTTRRNMHKAMGPQPDCFSVLLFGVTIKARECHLS